MKRVLLFVAGVLVACIQFGFSQQTGSIEGKVTDQASNVPVEYATIAVFSLKDSSLVNGTISDKKGWFNVEGLGYGEYYLKVDFLGYTQKVISGIKINPQSLSRSLEVGLQPANVDIEGVEVWASRPDVVYKIDKKVVNVSSNISASGGTAADALANAPSVETDIEGNVSLRGSSNFRVLIDGKPGIIDGSDALNSIPASAIENIEIITNPSAKYDPDGTAGIINVIMKKQTFAGLSGIVNASVGTGLSWSGDILVNYRTKKYALSLGFDNDERKMQSIRHSERNTYFPDSTVNLLTNSSGERNHGGTSVKAGIDYFLTPKNTLSVQGSYRDFGFGHNDETHTAQTISPDQVSRYYLSEDKTQINPGGAQLMLTDIHQFDKKGHELKLSASYQKRLGGNNESLLQYTTNSDWIISGMPLIQSKSNTDDNRYGFRIEADYTLPIDDQSTFEAGYSYRGDWSDLEYSVELFNPDLQEWEKDPGYSNNVAFNRDIHAFYATYQRSFGKLSAKGGIRGEYTHRLLDQLTMDKDYRFEKMSFYPSIYLSYELPAEQQLQLNYSKRVNRAREYMLNPITFFSDGFSSFVGNPELEPEYAHSYEFNYQKKYKKSSFTAETYYRNTVNMMSRVQRLNEEGVLEHTMININEDKSLGVEGMINYTPFKWWMINSSFSAYKYTLQDQEGETEVVKNSNNWRARASFRFFLPTKSQIQVDGMLNSPSVTIDGSREGFYFTSVAVKQGFLGNKLNATFSIRDIFDTARMKFSTEGVNYTVNSEFRRQAPMFNLSLSYKFNNYKSNERERGENGGGYDDVYMY